MHVEGDSRERTCVECQARFTITDAELELLERVARERGGEWELPRRCTRCRFARRASKFYNPVVANGRDEELQCVDCRVWFRFGGRDREYFARRGFATPRRCRPCRRQRSSAQR